MKPQLDDIQHIIRDQAAVAARKGRFVGVEHVLEDLEQGFKRHVEVDEGVDDPGVWTDAVLELECVAFEHGEEVRDGEHGFAELQSVA